MPVLLSLQCAKFIRNSPPKADATNEEKLEMCAKLAPYRPQR